MHEKYMCGHQKIKGQDISSGEYTSLPSIIVKQKLWPYIHYIRKCCSLVELVKAPIIEVAATKPQNLGQFNFLIV